MTTRATMGGLHATEIDQAAVGFGEPFRETSGGRGVRAELRAAPPLPASPSLQA